MSKSNLVLIHGLKTSGKSTLASHLIDNHDYVRVKMADPLKNMVRSLLRDAGIPAGTIEDYIEGDLKEVPIAELGFTTSRRLMMTLGEEWRNMHGERLWVNIALSKITKLLEEGRNVVVDDIRYVFEMEAFSALNPFKLVITRGDLHFEAFDDSRHPGERPMPISRFDFHFKNDFDVKIDLWDQLDAVMDIRSEYLRRMDVLVGLNQS
jgi:hypothetical protein